MYDVRSYAAVGTPNDAPVIQAAIDAAAASNEGAVMLGTYHPITQPIVVPANVNLYGAGKNVSWIMPSSRDFDAIQYRPAHGVTTTQGVNLTREHNATPTLQGFSIQYPALVLPPMVNGTRQYTDNGKYAIRLEAMDDGSGTPTEPAANMTQITIRDVAIINAPNGIAVLNTLGGLIDNCGILNFEVVGIEVGSPASPDGGGLIVRGTPIVNYQNFPGHPELVRGTGIVWRSGGSLKVIDCGFAVLYDGIRLIFEGNTSQFMVRGCNYDTMSNTGIRLSRNQGRNDARLTCIQMQGNEFAAPVGIYADPDAIAWLSDGDISGNMVRGAAGSPGSQIFVGGFNGCFVHDNYHVSNAAGSIAVNVHSSSSNVVIGRNFKRGPFAPDIPGSATVLPSP